MSTSTMPSAVSPATAVGPIPPPPCRTPKEENEGSTSDLENIAVSPATTRRSEDSDDVVDMKFRKSLVDAGGMVSPASSTNTNGTIPQQQPKSQQPFKVNQAARFNPSDRWTMVKVKVSFDVTRKGERSLVIDGFKFTKSRDGMADRVFWRCSRRECKATAVTVADRVEHVRAIHEHTPPLASEFFGGEASVGDLQEVRFNTCPGGGSSLKNRHRRRTTAAPTLDSKTSTSAAGATSTTAVATSQRASNAVFSHSSPTDLSVPSNGDGVDLNKSPENVASAGMNIAPPEAAMERCHFFGQQLTPKHDVINNSPQFLHNLSTAHQQHNNTTPSGIPAPPPATYIGVVNSNGVFQPNMAVTNGSSAVGAQQAFYQSGRMGHPLLVPQHFFNPVMGVSKDSLPLNLEVQRLVAESALRTSPTPGHTPQDTGHSLSSPNPATAVNNHHHHHLQTRTRTLSASAESPEPRATDCKRRQLEQMALQLLRETGGWSQARAAQLIPNSSRLSPLYSPNSSVHQSRWQTTQDSVGSSGEFSPRVSPRSTPVGQEQRSAGHASHSLLHWKKEKIKESVEEEEENTRKRRRSEMLYPECSSQNTPPSAPLLHDCQQCWDRIKGGILFRLLETTEAVGTSLTPSEPLDVIEHRCRVVQQCVTTMETVKRLKFSPETVSISCSGE